MYRLTQAALPTHPPTHHYVEPMQSFYFYSSEAATSNEPMASIEFAELLANLERMPGVSQTSELEASETGE